MKTASPNKAGIVFRYRHFIFYCNKRLLIYENAFKSAHLIFMTIIKQLLLYVLTTLMEAPGS
jgi:hypothetical protein